MALQKIGEVLISESIITKEQLNDALKQKKTDELLGEALVRLKYTTEGQILKALERITKIRRISLNKYIFDESVFAMVSEDFCRRNRIIPLKKDGDILFFATADPLNFSVFEELRIITGYRPRAFSATFSEIEREIEKFYGFTRTLEALGVNAGAGNEVIQESTQEQTPMVQLVNQILGSAVFQHASDIHIDPHDDKLLIRYRVDGVLDTVKEMPLSILNQIVSRIKVMSGMDITETRIPQDGRIQTNINNRNIDLRISTLPTVRGEKIVMRILDLSSNQKGIDTLGLQKDEEKKLRKMIAHPNGIILVSGPTGSGKTTTLYACLNELNRPDVNIITVEDPVEIRTEGVNQVQVNAKVDMTFANALRSILRQDPNIIMIGEIRDVETAQIAVRASLTGHLVLSTIHTNDAVKTITRLQDMNIESFLISSSLAGVVSQRLVRKLCEECSIEDEPSIQEKDFFQKYDMKIDHIHRAKGCPSCNYKGYNGRVGIFEILEMTDPLRLLINEKKSVFDLETQAKKQGMKTLIESGLEKVSQGITSLEEVLKVAYE
ncbi:MAG: Flp pilus assembly complex ATPase component TadA [Firmicutes bacterium]|nr:Flp pilus assembly complex ATPase component TadA [Bacillota bacterium]